MIQVQEGQSPIILCLPHSGTEVPPAVGMRLNATGRLQADLAWRLERVFGLRDQLDVTVLSSTVSRYVIDLDRDPQGIVNEETGRTGALCPVTTLDGKKIYKDGEEPGPTEIEQRTFLFFEPFHAALRRQIGRLQEKHRNVVVLDCQSMRSQIRGVTANGLPLASIGTADGTTCDTDLRNLFAGSLTGQQGYTVGVDEQTKGGFITRAFGRPENGIHALSLLLAQRSYLRHESPPFEPDKIRIARLQAVVSETLSRVIDWVALQDTPGSLPRTVASNDEGGQVMPVDPNQVAKVKQAQTAPVADEPVAPLLVAE